MQHRLEIAPSGRATCRTCNQSIAKGDLRLGEEYASQFGTDGFAIRWHHLPCAAKKIPDVLREAMASYEGDIPGREALETTMNEKPVRKSGTGALPSADLAPTGRAKCMKCQEAIDKGTVRIGVERDAAHVADERDGRFVAGVARIGHSRSRAERNRADQHAASPSGRKTHHGEALRAFVAGRLGRAPVR